MIKFKDMVIGHYYSGTSPKGNIAQWDGEDFVISLPPTEEDSEGWIPEWTHHFLAHPDQRGDDVEYGIVSVFVPYEDLTSRVHKEYADGES